MAATLIKDPLLTESNTGDLLGTEGVMLDNGTLHFQPPFSTACSALSGQQPQGSPPKMLPPVHFNILGKIQRRKPSSPSGLLPSSPRHVTGQTQSKSQKRSLLQLTNDSDSATRKTPRTERSSSADSPLDFSKKAKLEDVEEDDDDPASPSSRLRNILSMKCHMDPDSLPERVLNLSKEMESSPPSPTWLMGKLHPAGSAESSSCSPTLLDQRNSGLSSPSADIIMKSGSSTTSPCRISPPNNTTSGNPVNLAPYSLFTPVALNHMRPQLPLQLPMMDGNNGLALHPGLAVNPVQLPTNLPLAPSDSSSKGRTTRPFKDPMSFSTVGLYGLPLGTMPGSTEALIHQQSNAAYAEFRKQMLSQSNVHRSRRGNQRNVISHSNDPLASPLTFSMDNGSNGDSGSGKSGGKTEQQMKDEAYWERRRKNNEAAKRSRDARRAKEDEIAIRAAFLEQENLKLRFELCALKNETAKLRCMLYSS